MTATRKRILKNQGLSEVEISQLDKVEKTRGMDTSGYPPSGTTNMKLDSKFDPLESKIMRVIQMQFTPIKAVDVPKLSRGGGSAVRISENGQISLSSKIQDHFANQFQTVVFSGQDGDKRVIGLMPISEDVPSKLRGNATLKIGKGKKTGLIFLTAAGVLQLLKYDYKTSGSQTFPATWDEKNWMLTFPLPEGALVPKPKTERKKKEKKVEGELPSPPATEVEEADILAA